MRLKERDRTVIRVFTERSRYGCINAMSVVDECYVVDVESLAERAFVGCSAAG